MSEFEWIDTGTGRQTYRRRVEPNMRRSELPFPMLIADAIEPTQSMADGKFYESKQALRRTYRADGNPQGVEYIEVGNDQRPREQKAGSVNRDKSRVRESIEKAMAMADRGEGMQE